MMSNRGRSLLMDLSYNRSTPNPFNPTTTLHYRSSAINLKVYSILGLKVATLVDGRERSGYKTVRWDASSLSSGIYFRR